MRSILFLLIISILVLGCAKDPGNFTVKLSNPLDRTLQRTVEIEKRDLGVLCEQFERYDVKDLETGEIIPSQVIDTDQNGELEILVFRAELDPGETRKFELVLRENPVDYSGLKVRTFSRFVPERTDDYAWENDRVAFRTYGPTAQKMVEEKTPGGTLSSGIDCWLKRVDYPIIDKWYREHLEEDKSYHTDHGEGLDDFHVGPSRGCGGIGVWNAEEEKLYVSRNFSSWKMITEGPVRTQFELEYEPWETGSGKIREKKIISLDLGSNLMRVELELEADNMPETITTGITLHEKDGKISLDRDAGWFSYWQPHGDSEMGMGIVVPREYLTGFSEFTTDKKDGSHLYVHMKPIGGKIEYYAGFGWKQAGRFVSEEDWNTCLQEFSESLQAGLTEPEVQ